MCVTILLHETETETVTGAWATIVMTYAQNVANATKFLGNIIPPEDITMDVLQEMDHTCARRLANADLAATVLGLLKEHSAESVAEAWAAAIQIMYLGASLLLMYGHTLSIGISYSSTNLSYLSPLRKTCCIFEFDVTNIVNLLVTPCLAWCNF